MSRPGRLVCRVTAVADGNRPALTRQTGWRDRGRLRRFREPVEARNPCAKRIQNRIFTHGKTRTYQDASCGLLNIDLLPETYELRLVGDVYRIEPVWHFGKFLHRNLCGMSGHATRQKSGMPQRFNP